MYAILDRCSAPAVLEDVYALIDLSAPPPSQFNSATDALHDLGMIRCLRDADMVSDGQSAPRPVLDVVFTSFEGIIESALKAPVNASEWKLWEVLILTSVCTPAYFGCVRAIVASACMPAHSVESG